MVKRSIAISTGGVLSIRNRQLIHERDKKIVNTAPLEDLAIIVVETPEACWTSAALSECADTGIAIVFCGSKHLPTGILVPSVGNHLMAYTHRKQLEAKLPTKKRIWQTIITAKINAQAQVLRDNQRDDHHLRVLLTKIKSGDATNVEGVAAARYFPALFGDGFIREPNYDGVNSRLNYGYAIMRAAVVRAVVLSGLNPSVGIWHHNRFNPFALADDLIEPLRPIVDQNVIESLNQFSADQPELTPPIKRHLLGVLTAEVGWEGARFPLDTALQRYCAQVREALIEGGTDVQCPTR
jgi:CRISP-associated protein Cas1